MVFLAVCKLIGWTAIAVVIQSQGFATHALWTLQWVWMAVVALVCGREDGHAVKQWKDLRATFAHVCFPKFEVSAIALVPIFIEVDQDVNATV